MKSTLKRVTGSTDQPLTDGISRGVIITAVSQAATGVCVRLLDISDSDYLTYIQPGVIFLSLTAAGVFDRYLKPRLT